MHELAIAESVVASVLERTGDRHVSVVRLRVGRLAGVVPDALGSASSSPPRGPPLEGAALEIVEERGPRRTAGPARPTSSSPTRSCCATAAAPTSRCCPAGSSSVTSVEVG